MLMLFFLASVILFAAVFAGGVFIGKRPKKIHIPVGFAALLALSAVGIFNYFPHLEFSLFPLDFHAYFRRIYWVIAALFLLGIGVSAIPRRSTKTGLCGFSAVIFLVFSLDIGLTAFMDFDRFDGQPDKDGVCQQSTDYTCGPAVAVTLLRLWKVDATEGEMTRLALTTRIHGTDYFAMCRALNVKLKGTGAQVKFMRADWESLKRLKKPLLTDMRLFWPVGHWVTVLDFDPRADSVVVGDPLCGRQVLRRAEFEPKWTGNVVVVHVKDPFEK
jgi:predicted double-glycine peptidase